MNTPGTLFVVATPIGNMGDISARAIATLRAADVVYCEDTRVTAKLLAVLGLNVPTRSLHEHSSDKALHDAVAVLLVGKNVCYVSDAGTPGVSDPGGKLVAAASAAEVRVVPIPGASAVPTALSVAGFPTEPFTFAGFPPHKKGRNTFFADLALRAEAVVLYESTHRILKTLAALPQTRHAVVCRELTKLHETLYRGTIAEITGQLEKTSTKGEFVIVLAPTFWK